MVDPSGGRTARGSARVPVGLLMIIVGGLGLPTFVLGILETKRASTQAEETIRHDLVGAGLDWAQVRVERGQALLTGHVPESGLGSLALDIARGSECRRLLRDAPCARSVRANFGVTIREEEAWPQLTAQVGNGVLILAGTVPDQAARDAVLEAARSGLSSPLLDRVVDDMSISGQASPAGIGPLLQRVMKAVSLCSKGQAFVADGRTELRCDVTPNLADSVRYLLATPLPTGVLDVLELTSPQPIGAHDVTSQDLRGL